MMKVSRIQVEKFKNIRNLDFTVPTDATLLCLTGENGSGKSNLFRLLSMAIARLGMGGNPQAYYGLELGGRFKVTFDFNDEADDFWLGDPGSLPPGWTIQNLVAKWDKTISVELISEITGEGSGIEHQVLTAPGLGTDSISKHVPSWITSRFDSLGQLKYLHLQSDRVFDEEFNRYREKLTAGQASALGTLSGMKDSSSKSSRDLYADWIEYTAYVDKARLLEARQLARNSGSDGLIGYEDPLISLNRLVQSILPHIYIKSTTLEDDRLVIGSEDLSINFHDLSGGEREILFLCGQIDRLRLTRGILLIDEPELHLNPDLVRRFLTVVHQTSGAGQLWLATHSYEAIEAAGESNTFVMQSAIGKDTSLTSLRDQPVVKTLTAVLGRAGFGLSNTVFVVVEGSKDSIREKQRFLELTGHPRDIRLVDIGEGKRDVKRMLHGLLRIAEASGEQLSVKGVIDSDFDSMEPRSPAIPALFELGVHEVENLFLEPRSLEAAVRNFTRRDQPLDFVEMVRNQANATAGRWIWDRVQYKHNAEWEKEGKRALTQQCRGLISTLSWEDIDNQKTQLLQDISRVDQTISQKVRSAIGDFPTVRTSPDLWKHCFGKEGLLRISVQVGFNDHEKLERAVINAWDEGRAARPQELIDLRSFLGVTD